MSYEDVNRTRPYDFTVYGDNCTQTITPLTVAASEWLDWPVGEGIVMANQIVGAFLRELKEAGLMGTRDV